MLSRIAPTLLLIAAASSAQVAPPPPPPAQPAPAAVPAPAPMPRPVVAPVDDFDAPMPPMPAMPAMPAMPPMPPMPAIALDQDRMFELQDKLHALQDMDIDVQVEKQLAMAADQIANMNLNLKFGGSFAYAPQVGIGAGRGRGGSADRAYENGQRALEGRRYTEALEYFNQVAASGGSRADGALYWKAYTLIKLGRPDEARAAIAELRKSYASSRWLDDAKALEVDAGKPISPESESDEELKLMALNGLMQSDPDRAFPLLENLLKSAQPPRIKRNAVYVLAQSNAPKAQQLLEQVARGQGNPDMQLVAIRYLGEKRRQGAGNPVLAEVYASTSDPDVKRAILNAYENARDKDRLIQVAKSESNQDLRIQAIRMLGSIPGAQPDMWSLYQAESTPEGKRSILEAIPSTGNLDKFVEIARTEKDPGVRRFAIHNLGSTRAATTGDTLASIYPNEQDQQVKMAIIDALSNQKSVKPLITIARSEKDTRMKQRILERLINMKSPEANDYLMEIIGK